jgi:hypothetical protein
LTSGGGIFPTVIEVLAEHPLWSVTVTVYTPLPTLISELPETPVDQA